MTAAKKIECAACGRWAHRRWLVPSALGDWVCKSGPACDRRLKALGLTPLEAL